MVSQYTGVDVVRLVIDPNMRLHTSDCVSFVCADLTCDPLPPAGAVLVRPVLQHLSNSEIKAALANILRTYPLAFITEHIYIGSCCVPNRDIPHGPGTRVPSVPGFLSTGLPSTCGPTSWVISSMCRKKSYGPGRLKARTS